jgi:hypothetical protein
VGEVTVVAVEDILEEVIEGVVEVLVTVVAYILEEVIGAEVLVIAVAIAEAVMQYTADVAIAVQDALVTVEDTEGTTIEDMHQEGPYSELFSVEWLLEAPSARSGGLTTPYRYLRPIMTHTTNIHILHLLMSLRFRLLKPLTLIRKDLRRRQRRQTNVMRPKLTQAEM